METVNELNAVLKGEYMAIHAYEQFLQKTQDSTVQQALKKIQEEHKRHAAEISERIDTLGGEPVDGTGIMSEVMLKLKGMGEKETTAILKDAFAGEQQGIEMSQEMVKGDLDEQSMSLIQNILQQDKEHLMTLLDLIEAKNHQQH